MDNSSIYLKNLIWIPTKIKLCWLKYVNYNYNYSYVKTVINYCNWIIIKLQL